MWTPIEIYQGQPGATETTLATVPSGKQWVVKEIIICNTTTTNRKLSIAVRRGGAAVADANRIMKNRVIAAEETIYWPCSIAVNATGILSALAEVVSAITLTVSGEERATS